MIEHLVSCFLLAWEPELLLTVGKLENLFIDLQHVISVNSWYNIPRMIGEHQKMKDTAYILEAVLKCEIYVV